MKRMTCAGTVITMIAVIAGCDDNARLARMAEEHAKRQAAQSQQMAERSEVGRQRDALETERRTLAAQRYREPLVAAAITQIGLLLACLLPLVLCWFLLRREPAQADEALVAQLLIGELTTDEPLLLPSRSPWNAISCEQAGDSTSPATDR